MFVLFRVMVYGLLFVVMGVSVVSVFVLVFIEKVDSVLFLKLVVYVNWLLGVCVMLYG